MEGKVSEKEELNYKTIKLPRAMLDKLDKYVRDHPELGFASSADLIRQCLRLHYFDVIFTNHGKK